MRSRTTDDSDRTLDLRHAIDRTGYYPEVVADGVEAAIAGEQVVSFYVHHEPTFERDEVRRHLSVIVLTPSRRSSRTPTSTPVTTCCPSRTPPPPPRPSGCRR
jgi:hypothetical protein